MDKIIGLFLITIITISSYGNNSKCYVTFEIDGYKVLEKFTVFVQNQSNPIYFYGFEIIHERDSSETINSDQYRLQKGIIYKLIGGTMKSTGLIALALGESECVYRALKAIDFTGGWYGDKQFIERDFIWMEYDSLIKNYQAVFI